MKTHKSRNHRTSRRRTISSNEMANDKPFFSARTDSSAWFGLQGKGPAPVKAVNFGGPVALRGLTEADFSNNKWALVKESGKKSSGCEGCSGNDCIQYSATVRSTFKVSTKVTLPDLSEYSDYTACQQRLIKSAIKNELAPHEQKHVAAYKKYDGTVDTPITMTGCKSGLESQVAERAEEIHLKIEAPRRADVKAESDKLDPFEIRPNLKCT